MPVGRIDNACPATACLGNLGVDHGYDILPAGDVDVAVRVCKVVLDIDDHEGRITIVFE